MRHLSIPSIVIIALTFCFQACSESGGSSSVNKGKVRNIPVIWVTPKQPVTTRSLVIWQDGFTGQKENTVQFLQEFADLGIHAVSFDNFEHGDRAIKGEKIWRRVFADNNFRKGMWPIIGQSVEDASKVIDWAVKEFDINGDICMGGFSMGGDIAVATAGVDKRIKCVAAIVSTPEWTRPNMRGFTGQGLIKQGQADARAQKFYDAYNPATRIEDYAHKPAITFESGSNDTHIPASDAKAFKEALLKSYQDMEVRVVEHPAGHELSPGMWKNAKQWIQSYLVN